MRCFVALDVSESTRALASQVHHAVVAQDPSWRSEKWVALENLHVTLAFLGEVRDVDAQRLARALSANTSEPFMIGLPRIVAVPGPPIASMLWFRYEEGVSDCFRLASYVRACARELGLAPVDAASRFVPHVTLVRSRRGRPIAQGALNTARCLLESRSDQSVSVSSVRVISSSMGSTGPRYREVANVPLLGA